MMELIEQTKYMNDNDEKISNIQNNNNTIQNIDIIRQRRRWKKYRLWANSLHFSCSL